MRPIPIWATAVVSGVLALIAAGTASAATVYNNIPSPLGGNYPSQAFEATQTAEFGGLVELASGSRTNPVVTVTMSSWGCQSRDSLGACVTTPGAVFSVPITLNIYAVNADNSVGALLATDTQTFKIPYRPSDDATNCPKDADGTRWFDGTSCYHGLANKISWDLGGRTLTLPDKVIVSVMYNSSHYGYQPIGEGAPCYSKSGGCGYDSLNVAVVPNSPFVGNDPLPDSAYVSSTWSGAYCSGSALGIFRLDAGCWTGYRPAIQVDTYAQQTGPAGVPGPAGPAGATGAAGTNGTDATATPAVKVQTRLQTKFVKVKISITKRTVSFGFSGSGGKGKLSFQCRLDKAKYKSCRSGKSYKHLKLGKHVFRVRAKDAGGKLDQTPATRKFKL